MFGVKTFDKFTDLCKYLPLILNMSASLHANKLLNSLRFKIYLCVNIIKLYIDAVYFF